MLSVLLALAAHPVVLQAEDQPPNLELQPQPPPKIQSVAVLILSGEETKKGLSELYGDARKAIEENTALNVAPEDFMGLSQRDEAVRECAGKSACFARKVRSNSTADVDQLLTVSIDRLDEGTLIGFRLVDVVTGEELGAAGDEIPMGMSVLGAMEKQLQTVFPKTVWGQISSVEVVTEPDGAEVNVAGRTCVSPCSLTRVPPGTYSINIKKSGYESWSGAVTLSAKQTSKVQQALEEPPGGIITNPFLWIGIGAVVVGGAIAAIFLARPDDRIVNICIADNPDLCEQ